MSASGKPTGLSQAEPEEVSALTGFDPSRMNAEWFVALINDYGGGYYTADAFCDSKTFHKRYPEFIAVRQAHKAKGDRPSEAMVAALLDFAEAIAAEARRAETENTGSVHEGAGPQDIAHD